jgi:hypothetical protein
MTRSRVIQVWFAAVALAGVAAVALGATMTLGTGILLTVLVLIPPGVVIALWPAKPKLTVGDVLHGTEQARTGR